MVRQNRSVWFDGTTLVIEEELHDIWLVQLSSYRWWAYVGSREFRAYHVLL